ncbi:MAG: alpha/beta hydrolase [Deltaproteobacteria bacterium]|nr:MAG: alpha/beta hydrolase [Deltaproteobacteria bacterium]
MFETMKACPIPKKYIDVGRAKIAYIEDGNGSPIIFIHGYPTSSFLWRKVIKLLSSEYRCYAPDLLGLGDTEVSLEEDFSMPSQAEMIKGFMDDLKIDHATIVAHDQGGACGEIFAIRYPDRVKNLILVDCVAYDNWPVSRVKLRMRFAKLPIIAWMFESYWFMRCFYLTRFGLKGSVYDKSKITTEVITEYLRPIYTTRERKRKFRKFLLSGNCQYTMDIASELQRFDKPTLIIWAAEDRFLPVFWGEKLYKEIPGARRFELITFAGHLLPEEKPVEIARIIVDFLSDGK